MQNEKRFQGLYRVVTLAYYLGTAATLAFVLWAEKPLYLAAMTVAALVLPVLPWLLYRFLRLRPVYILNIIFETFVFVAVPFASVLGGYNLIPGLDKVLHFASGFLFAVVGTLFYYYHKEGRRLARADALNVSFFAWMFANSSALVWEIYEYTLSLFGPDPQLVAATGVGDTMTDMIVCTLGGGITAIACYRYLKHLGEGRRHGVMMTLFESFYQANLAPRE